MSERGTLEGELQERAFKLGGHMSFLRGLRIVPVKGGGWCWCPVVESACLECTKSVFQPQFHISQVW